MTDHQVIPMGLSKTNAEKRNGLMRVFPQRVVVAHSVIEISK